VRETRSGPFRMPSLLERWFRLKEHGTSARVEILGGVTTFAAMAYIIVVNPAILTAAGIPPGPCTIATILAAAFGTLLMGLYANRPIAVAPYMGENVFIAFTLSLMLVDGERVTWQQCLGVVFVSGAAFLVLTLLRLRTWLADSISTSMKHSFAVGIGLFLLFIGLYQTGIVRSGHPGTPVKIGDLQDIRVLLALGGFFLMAVLLYWRFPAAILIGIVGTGLVGYLLEVGPAPSGVFDWPWSGEYDLSAVAFQLDIAGVLRLSFVPVLLTLFLMTFLDTLATLVALGSAGNMLDERGNFPNIHRPMLVDSLACMFSALVGTSASGAYIESATGIREGARTGLAALVTAALFLVALFFIPLIQPFQQLAFAYGPALMIVGVLMLAAVQRIDFEDMTEAVPAVATIVMMVFTFNIANGLTAGLALYPLFKLAAGRVREVHAGAWVLAGLCLSYFVFGQVH
jgi:adenine/guanine/hypoxanthine permease